MVPGGLFTMKCYVSQDFASNTPVQEALELIEIHRGRIIDFTSHGPAGGNPCIMVAFDTRQDAMGFLRKCQPPEESDEFLRSLVVPLLR
jgi:hypothetical protein